MYCCRKFVKNHNYTNSSATFPSTAKIRRGKQIGLVSALEVANSYKTWIWWRHGSFYLEWRIPQRTRSRWRWWSFDLMRSCWSSQTLIRKRQISIPGPRDHLIRSLHQTELQPPRQGPKGSGLQPEEKSNFWLRVNALYERLRDCTANDRYSGDHSSGNDHYRGQIIRKSDLYRGNWARFFTGFEETTALKDKKSLTVFPL